MAAVLDYVRGFWRIGRDARLWALSWGLLGFGFFGVQSVLLNLYLLRLGYAPDFVGLPLGLGQLTSVAMCLPGVAIGRRLGHRNAMLAGAPLTVLSGILLLLSEGLPETVRGPWLVGSWILAWVGSPVWIVNADPYVMSVTTDDTRRYAFAGQGAATAVGGLFGGLLAGWLPGALASRLGTTLESPLPFRLTLLLAPLAYSMVVLCVLRARSEPPIPTSSVPIGTAEAPRRLLFYIAGLMVLMRLGSGALSFVNVYLDAALAVPTVRIGALIGGAEVVPIALAAVIPLLLARWGAGRALAGAAVCTAAGLVALALLPHWVAASVAYVGAAVAVRAHFVARSLFAQQAVAPRWRGLAAASVEIGSALGMAGAAYLGGYLIVDVGYRWMFLAAAGMSLAAVAMLSLYLRREARRPTTAMAAPSAM